jgi:FkbM family methyltransferase
MDLFFNGNAAFTDWIVNTGALREPFVVIDVGVQGGDNVRWHRLGDHLVVHGFDAIREVVEELRQQNRRHPNRHFHWIAAGSADEERDFYFNAADPYSSSLYSQGADRFGRTTQEQHRKVQVRRLDTLLQQGLIVPPDFIKVDVEGFEKEVFLGASQVLKSALGIETETSFHVSPTYPRTHFGTLQEILLQHHMLVFDLNFARAPRATFQSAVERKGLSVPSDQCSLGKPSTFNILFCRDAIDETDHPESYVVACQALSVDQLLKIMIIYEIYGLNDIALDTAERFRGRLGDRIDIDKAVSLLSRFCLVDQRIGSVIRW